MMPTVLETGSRTSRVRWTGVGNRRESAGKAETAQKAISHAPRPLAPARREKEFPEDMKNRSQRSLHAVQFSIWVNRPAHHIAACKRGQGISAQFFVQRFFGSWIVCRRSSHGT